MRAVPAIIDPYRLAYTNEYPVSSMFRRSVLDEVGGWVTMRAYEDWHLWMTLAERGSIAVHMGPGGHIPQAPPRNPPLDRLEAHPPRAVRPPEGRPPRLFGSMADNRRRSSLHPMRKLLYPIVYGGRRRFGWGSTSRACSTGSAFGHCGADGQTPECVLAFCCDGCRGRRAAEDQSLDGKPPPGDRGPAGDRGHIDRRRARLELVDAGRGALERALRRERDLDPVRRPDALLHAVRVPALPAVRRRHRARHPAPVVPGLSPEPLPADRARVLGDPPRHSPRPGRGERADGVRRLEVGRLTDPLDFISSRPAAPGLPAGDDDHRHRPRVVAGGRGGLPRPSRCSS